MDKVILGKINRDDLTKYREVCALVEVAKSPPPDMTTARAKQAWVDYYAMVADLHNRYHVPEDERLDVVISVGNGLIVLEED